MKLSPRPLLLVVVLLALLAVTLLLSAPAFSYLPNFTTPGPQPDHWATFPVSWNLNPTTGSNISGTATRSVVDVITASFNTWNNTPNAAINLTRGPDSSISSESASNNTPGTNLICFICSDTDFSKDATTLAVTITTTANQVGQGGAKFVGQILKADILFNPNSSFTTDGSTATAQDLQTVATHEIGHFLGLDHSGVVRSVMFPAASSITTLSYDDIAGLSLLYPKTTPDVATGTMSGTVSTTGGGVVFGAHVYAESVTGNQPFSAFPNIRKSPIGTLTRPDGTYSIQGVPPDSYIVTAEPLDGPVSNTDVSGYPKAFGQTAVQTNFTTRWH